MVFVSVFHIVEDKETAVYADHPATIEEILRSALQLRFAETP